MTSKEKKIKEIYGDFYKACAPDSNGFTRQGFGHHERKEAREHFNIKAGNIIWRPSELNGIEDNNGWIRNDEDFPKQSGKYVFLSKAKIEHKILLRFPLSKEEENHYRNDFTHFRVPKHHPLPIY